MTCNRPVHWDAYRVIDIKSTGFFSDPRAWLRTASSSLRKEVLYIHTANTSCGLVACDCPGTAMAMPYHVLYITNHA